MSEYEPLDSDGQSSLIIKRRFNEEIVDDNIIFIKANDENIYFPNFSTTNFTETKEQPFVMISQNKSNSEKLLEKKRKSSHLEENNSEKIEKIKKKQRKFEKDNILIKIQVHYITFITKFLNSILETLHYDEKLRFKQIQYSFKKDIRPKNFESLKSKQIYEIITNKISSKNKNNDENFNKNLYEKIKNDEFIKNILHENYLKLFRNIYFKSERKIDLKNYGLDVIINLSDEIKMYKDIEYTDKQYINILDNYVKKNYFSCNKIFKISKI